MEGAGTMKWTLKNDRIGTIRGEYRINKEIEIGKHGVYSKACT